MSAGDIIDRAVRLYKRNFLTLVRIVLAPSLVAYLGSILFWIGARNFSLMRGDARVATTTMMIVGGGLLWALGEAAFYAVLGGSSRSLVAHFFDGRPILAREVYASVWERKWALIGAILMIGLMVVAISWLMMVVLGIVMVIIGAIAANLIAGAPDWAQAVFGIVSFLATAGLLILSFLLVYSRAVYVPQILMVERKGVFSSISRSFQLARGELIRIAAVIFFWIYVAWSIWFLMAVPVGWYAYAAGVDITPFNLGVPLWYDIAKQTLTQLSKILIGPIAMLCFTLLYLNSRVRKEGYDVELLANRVLAPPPAIPQPRPAVQSSTDDGFAAWPAHSILGLSDYRPVAPVVVPPFEAAATTTTINVEEPIASAFQQAETGMPAEFAPLPVETPIEVVAAPRVIVKTCRWCNSEAEVEDRFCRVCGSVF
jgi:hypothetical protein